MKRRLVALLLALSLAAGLLSCGEQGETEQEQDFTVRAAVCQRMTSLDPAHLSVDGGETVVACLFENLLRWEPGENGQAVLTFGQAESYTAEESYDGSVTYTFTIRRGLRWSDGEEITAEDFLYTWQRLFDPESPAVGISGLSMLRGYYSAYTEGNLDGLGVSAPDNYTFVITLDAPCAYFLEEFCAGVMTMPVQKDAVSRSGWDSTPEKWVGNGPYVLESLDGEKAVLVRNEAYYDQRSAGPDRMEFSWSGSEEEVAAGTLDLLDDVPEETAEQLAAEESWQPDPVLSTYTLLLNNESAPFDNALVRQALASALDREALVEAACGATAVAATGLVPRGVSDRSGTAEEKTETTATVPQAVPTDGEAAAEPQEVPDFRSVGDGLLTTETLTVEESQARARQLLAQAGYPNGLGFPEVEYLYVDSPENRLMAQALRKQWQEVLNIEVTARAMTEDELRQLLLDGTYTCAGFAISAAHDDAALFLSRWATGKVGNLVRGSDEGYDLLMEIADRTFDAAAREAYLHDAEELLLQACGVVPLFYYGRAHLLADGLTGLMRCSSGTYLLQWLRRSA